MAQRFLLQNNMALAIVNICVPTLSSKKSLANNFRLRKPVVSRVPSSISKICNSLQSRNLPSSNQFVFSEDETEDYADWDHKPHNSYPSNFIFGAASAAFQVEGATKVDGRGPSIWDTFCEKYPGKIAGGATGEPGAGSYYRYKEDVKLLVDIGLEAYRFSISWSRVLPNGRQPNELGISYYNKLIDELILNGIKPFVTLFHWDVPQALEDEYGGFLSRRIVDDYKIFANLCFDRFGDRVKHWITMNEPSMFCSMGYGLGLSAPGHCTPDLYPVGGEDLPCPTGDSLREPYRAGHNLLLAHAEAVDLYRKQYKAKNNGVIGITLCSMWFEPYDNLPQNKEAQHRALNFNLGWFMDPLKFGNYPFSMRALVADRLPIFTPEESKKLKDSFDFIGLNYYSSRYARDNSNYNYTQKPTTSEDDPQVSLLVDRGELPIGPAEPKSWVNVYPKGLKKLLLHIKERYNNPEIYITENGVLQYSDDPPSNVLGTTNVLPPIDDIYRIEFHTSHLHELEDALSSKANVKGYFVWSLLDSFEWISGYTCRFGLNHINYDNLQSPDLRRYPKQSASWLARFLKNINKDKVVQAQPLNIEAAPLVIVTDR